MEKKVLLSIKDLEVKFRVRGRILTAIRGISLDIYENESIAIVGESGSGKSVFTKTFAGMLDSNGFIANGSLLYNDPALSDTLVSLTPAIRKGAARALNALNEYSKLELGGKTYKEIKVLEKEKHDRETLSDAEACVFDDRIKELQFKRTETFNRKQTLDPSKEKDEIRKAQNEINAFDAAIKQEQEAKKQAAAAKQAASGNDHSWQQDYERHMKELKARYDQEISGQITTDTVKRNEIMAKEIMLSIGRYPTMKRMKALNALLKALKKAMTEGQDLNDEEVRNSVFGQVTFRVRYLDETADKLHGTCVIDLSQIKEAGDWSMIRGSRIATVFQDPMTSLNPIITIGKQITSIILKHQHCSEVEARSRALDLMGKVGIPNPEKRFDDYPFEYSGGMRQRIVIAIALSCQPKVLICDEPTTALDVTIQAQILKLLKDLQRELGFTIVFITHDLGVVANVADRVAVMYAGQIIEWGNVDEVFYDPRHPYTWALLSSLPQLAEKNTELYSIAGTPPSLYNKIVGDPFAPRNPYCLKIDTLVDPPMMRVTDTHYAKTWLLDPRAPKVEKPHIIDNIHEKLIQAFNI